MDFDKECGFWLYNRPYVWIQGKTKETSRRLYLVYFKDLVYIRGWENPIPYKSYYYKVNPGEDKKYNLSMLNLYSNEKQKMCSWASRYFEVYVPWRDGKIQYLEVRRNGEILPKSNRVTSYLKGSGFHKAGGKNFLKLPDWLNWNIVGKFSEKQQKERIQEKKEREEEEKRRRREEQEMKEQKRVEDEYGFFEF